MSSCKQQNTWDASKRQKPSARAHAPPHRRCSRSALFPASAIITFGSPLRCSSFTHDFAPLKDSCAQTVVVQTRHQEAETHEGERVEGRELKTIHLPQPSEQRTSDDCVRAECRAVERLLSCLVQSPNRHQPYGSKSRNTSADASSYPPPLHGLCETQTGMGCANGVMSYLVGNVIHHNRRRRPPVVHGRKATVSLLPGRIPNLKFYSRVIELHFLRQECRCGKPTRRPTKSAVAPAGEGWSVVNMKSFS